MLAGQAVATGQLTGVLAPLLALVPLALAEVLALLPPAAAHVDTLRQARSRLAEVMTEDSPDVAAPRGEGSGVVDGGLCAEGASPVGAVTAGLPGAALSRGEGSGAVDGGFCTDGAPLIGAAAAGLSGTALPRGEDSGPVGCGLCADAASADGVAVRGEDSGRAGCGLCASGGGVAVRGEDSGRAGCGLCASGGGVVVRGAAFGWPGGDVVLRGVDLEVAAGSYVAVVGASGAGKSTLVAALLGFLAPREGEVVVPERVAWAPQEPMLVSTTVAENLRLADPTATERELRRVLELAELPDLDPSTMLDSAGAGLSGGQAQRVALARALLAAPAADLVLLDEPTAHLDEPTAHALRATLRTELAGCTVVHVTHTAEEARAADVVYEVRDGRVIRRGTDATGAPGRDAGVGRRGPDGERDPAARVTDRDAAGVHDSRRGADGERGIGGDESGAQVTEDAGVGW
jgi:ABC-type multidrug transport system fused ATPase/permease subunit